MAVYRLEIEARPYLCDALGTQIEQRLRSWLGLSVARVKTRQVYHLDLDLGGEEAQMVLEALVDPVAEVGAVGQLPDGWAEEPEVLTIGFKPGVTDTVGATVKRAAEDRLGRSLTGAAYHSTMVLVWGLSLADLQRAAAELLYNPLIQRVRFDRGPRMLDLEVPRAGARTLPVVESVSLRTLSGGDLTQLSTERLLALSELEMTAIAEHYRQLGREPTDAELECIAQTWSEHCKHKIFAAPINVLDPHGETRPVAGLFKTYIRGATEAVAAARHAAGEPTSDPFLLSVFHDNAGVVRFSPEDHLVYKVETHNSPSALDPYGGAMTGIVGVNRDSFGTGLGAELLTNVWGYCLGDPHHAGALPLGLLHPRRIRDGVHRGVADGGNHSGVPYSRGFELFDPCYLGKPLVFCGTVAVMPRESASRPTHIKYASVGDAVVMVGGRVGKDGIHGATFSSLGLDETAPAQAVQIGDPLTQKMMFDMLSVARETGLISAITDNGAGGLSSSVGEMAQATGGARIDLARAPLKYQGLQPWEILVSEAQERMTVAVPQIHLEDFLALARRYEVEATVLGRFTDDGKLSVLHDGQQVAELDLEFLHDGVPLPPLEACFVARAQQVPNGAQQRRLEDGGDLAELVLAMARQPEFASKQERCRGYDHEVKGLSVIKPMVGVYRDVPATATVMRARHGRPEGVVLAEGLHPFYAELDPRAMAMASVDEGVRRVLCAGARIDRIAALDNFCWPDPVRSEKTPDGAHKLGQLVSCCEGLHDACVAYGVPLISGKDSMKNDANMGGVKISIRPTLLVSVMGQMEDVSQALDLVVQPGQDLWLLGATKEELGGSAVMRYLGLDHYGHAPATDLVACWARYRAFCRVRDAGQVKAAHVVGRGGLLTALNDLVLASDRAIEVDLGTVADLPSFVALAAESTGRILFAAAAQDRDALVAALEPHGGTRIGAVGDGDSSLTLRRGQGVVCTVAGQAIREAFTAPLAGL